MNNYNIKTFAIAMTLTLIVWSHVGCQRAADRYDERLTAADSVMHHDADSALTLLETLDVNTLKSQADRAYHALLLSQARYRCYIVATSDSLINIALQYYEQHHDETEKLTRSYLYKGAVMEELDEAESAMTYYKRAVTNASPDDYFNQGYARFRMGNIYRDNLVTDSSDIKLMQEALGYFRQVPDSFYILSSLVGIGSSYIPVDEDSALAYLNQAVVLSRQLQEQSMEQLTLTYIADMKMFSNEAADIKLANEIALTLLNDSCYPENKREQMLMIASLTSAKLNQPEAARAFLNQVNKENLTVHRQVLYDRCLAEIALAHRDFGQYQRLFERSYELSDSLMTNDLQRRLREVDAAYDNEALKYQALKYKTRWLTSLLLAALLVSFLVILLLIIKRKSATRKRQLKESNDAIERLANDKSTLTTKLRENQMMSEDLKQVIRNQIEVFTQLVEQYNLQFTHSPKKFSELFQRSYDINQPDSSFWSGLRAYADSTCGGIITQTVASCPELSETDVKFLSLYCCDLPTTVTMVCMGYNEAHSVYNKKRRIAEALSLEGRLDDYIMQFRNLAPADEEMTTEEQAQTSKNHD